MLEYFDVSVMHQFLCNINRDVYKRQEEGKGISQQMIEARRDMASTVFGVLNEEEQEQLEMLLSKLISELEKNQGEEFSG